MDNTDNIVGIPGVGIKTAQKILKDCDSKLDFEKAVIEAYQNKFKELWALELYKTKSLVTLVKKLPKSYLYLADKNFRFNIMETKIITPENLFEHD